MKLNYKQQLYNPVGGRKHVYCSCCLDYKGNFEAKVHKHILDYDNLDTRDITITFKKGIHPFLIHRYIKFSLFRDSINGKYISFVSPYKWYDPYETLFYDPNVKIGNDNYKVSCMCCCYDDVESEESAWGRSNLEQTTNNKIIKVSYNMDALCDIMENFANNNNQIDFYISIVDYSQSKTQLIPSNKHATYSCIDEYINIMSLKRKAFAYENELRIFAVAGPNYKSSFFDNEGIFKASLCCPIKAIEKITLPPLKPILRNEPEFDIYSKLQDVQNFELRKDLMQLLPGVQINQSRLYQLGSQSSKWINRYSTNIW